MDITFDCPECGKTWDVAELAENEDGDDMACPDCGYDFTDDDHQEAS